MNSINSERFEKMWEELVPASGNASSLAGEMIRAAGRLRHDFYNNGMGNNTSGALNFLREKGAIDKELHEYVLPYTTGRLYEGRYENDLFHVAIDRIVEITSRFIAFNPQLIVIENTEDMFDYTEDDLDETCQECSGYGYDDYGDEDCYMCDGTGFVSQ